MLQRKEDMTAIATAPTTVKAPPFGNWTRYLITVKDHEDWVFESTDNYRGDKWWEVDFNKVPTYTSNTWGRLAQANGWIRIENQGATDFKNWETPFFYEPREIYKLLRACIRRHNDNTRHHTSHVIEKDEQKKIWAWAFENLIVYKVSFNLHTLTGTKEQIDFKQECCPKSISQVY